MFPRFFENLLESQNLACSITVRTKTALGILQFCFHYFVASFLKTRGIHFSREAKEGVASVVSAFSLVFVLVYRAVVLNLFYISYPFINQDYQFTPPIYSVVLIS